MTQQVPRNTPALSPALARSAILSHLRQAALSARQLGLSDGDIDAAVGLGGHAYDGLQVAFHRSGEAVLLLTSVARGHAVPVPVRLIDKDDDGWCVDPERMTLPNSTARISGTDGQVWFVREPAHLIVETLSRLAEREGGAS